MRLTDNEKRDAIKLIQGGKPLPEKYRFLLFKEDREVELVWNGKTNEVTNTVLPFQTIEHIDEPRSEQKRGSMDSLFDTSGRQMKGWTNKLIWGDNKLILSSLKNGPLRKEIEAQGGLKLIYIDPPFDVGADFSMNIEIGDEQFTKQPSVIEEVAFRDTWGLGTDSFIAMIYERLSMMKDLLSEDGSIYVHCDSRVNSYLRLILNEVFGEKQFVNEIVWKRRGGALNNFRSLGSVTDTIFLYTKSENSIFNAFRTKDSEETQTYIKERFVYDDGDGRLYSRDPITNPSATASPSLVYEYKGYKPPAKGWAFSKKTMEDWDKKGKLYFPPDKTQRIRRKTFLDEYEGQPIQNLWSDVFVINSQATESLGYPTQKPEKLLERIIQMSSNKGDLIADFFCGSGTTLSIAEKLDRKWIGSDLGRFAVHTSRKRMVGVQRELKKSGKDYRAFEILNIGRYERESLLGLTSTDERGEVKRKIRQRKEKEFINLILSAYKAEPVESSTTFVGKKRDRLVAIGPINAPVSSGLVEDILSECREKNITKADVLGFDYEMGLDFSDLKKQGVDIQFRVIPREVFDKQAVEKGQVKFYDVAYVEIKPIIKKGAIAVELIDFSVFYNQDDSGEIVEKIKPGGSKVVIREGKVIKITKDKQSDIVEEEVLTKKWTDWVDYWAVDFDFENKREVVRVKDLETGKEKETWTGGYIFENEWQSFRTKKDRLLELVTPPHEVPKGKRKIAIKVVDIFGNDTTRVIEVTI